MSRSPFVPFLPVALWGAAIGAALGTPSLSADEVVVARGLVGATPRFAIDGSLHAAFVVPVGSGARVVAGDAKGELFDEIDPRSVFVTEGGKVVYTARRAMEHLVVWSGGQSEPFAMPPTVAVAPNGRAWMAFGERSDGTWIGYVNGSKVGPYARIDSDWRGGRGASSVVGFERLYIEGLRSPNDQARIVHLANGATQEVPRRSRIVVSSDGRRIAAIDGVKVSIDGRERSLANEETAQVDLRLGPAGTSLASVRAIGRPKSRQPRYSAVLFTSGVRHELPVSDSFLPSPELSTAEFTSDGSDFVVAFQGSDRHQGGAAQAGGIVTKSGVRHSGSSGFTTISSLAMVAEKPFFIGSRPGGRRCIVWGDWISPELASPPRVPVISDDRRHFVVDAGDLTSRVIYLGTREVRLSGGLEALAIAPTGGAAAVLTRDSSNLALVRIDVDREPVRMPIERADPVTPPVFSPDGSKLAIGYMRGRSAGVLLDGREFASGPLEQLIHFGDDGSATAEVHAGRGPARTLFFSPDSSALAFFTGLPNSATLHLAGRQFGPFRPIGVPRFGADGAFEFMTRAGDDAVLMRIDPRRTQASAPSAPLSATPAPARPDPSVAPIRTTGEFKADVTKTDLASRRDLKPLLGFAEPGSRIVLARRAGTTQRGDEVHGTREFDVVEAFFDGRVVARADQAREAVVSGDGTKAAFAISDDRGDTSFVVLDGKSYGGTERGSQVRLGALSHDGGSIAYWILKGSRRSGSITLMHDDRAVHTTMLSDGVMLDDDATTRMPIFISEDGRRVAAFLPLISRGRVPAGKLLLDGKTHDVPGPCLLAGRSTAGFVGANQRFVALVGLASSPRFWVEGKGLTPELQTRTGAAALSAANGRFAIGAPDLHDSAGPDGFESPVLEGRVVMGPVLSPDGVRLVCAVSEFEGAPPTLVIDGEASVMARRFSPAVFSNDGRRLVYGFEALESPANWTSLADASRGAYRLGVDGATFEVDSYPESVGFSPDGRQVWAVGARDTERGREWNVMVNGSAGPPFEMVEDVVFSPDGRAFAYLATKGGRSLLLVNHQVVARFAEPAGLTLREGFAPSAPGTAIRARPAFVGSRNVVMHVFDSDLLQRIDVTLQGELPPIPSLETARPTRSPAPERSDAGEMSPSDDDPRSDHDLSELEREMSRAMEEAARRFLDAMKGSEGPPPGLEGRPVPPTAASSDGPGRRPGRAAKSTEVERFVGQWNVILKSSSGDELEDVLRVGKDGTLVSDHGIDFEIESVPHEVRSVDGVLRLYAQARRGGASLAWVLELSGSELKVAFEEKLSDRTRKYEGRARR